MSDTGLDSAVPLERIDNYTDLPADFVEAVRKVERSTVSMRAGDPAPYIDLWARSDDVTLYGAWGPIERGIDRLVETFGWVGTRFTGGQVEFDYFVVGCSGDLGFTIGFERGQTSVDNGAAALMVIRVTHHYRRIDGEWLLTHRHADHPPRDER